MKTPVIPPYHGRVSSNGGTRLSGQVQLSRIKKWPLGPRDFWQKQHGKTTKVGLKWSKHMWKPKKIQWFEIVKPLRFPVKNSYFRSPRPGTISLLKRQQLGDEICYFWMEKGVVYHWMEQGTKKNFRFNWVNRKITPKWLVFGMVFWVYHIIWFYLRCNELAMKSVFIEYSISFPSDFS